MGIQAVFFDMGGTIETYGYTRQLRLEATAGIRQRLQQAGVDLGLTDEALYEVISAGLESYKRFSIASLDELPPQRVWSEFIFRDYDIDRGRLAAIAEELAFLVETSYFGRAMRPEMPAVLEAIRRMGLKIGLISNVNSRGQVPANLKAYGIYEYFDPIVLSSEYGRRKPDPAIFHYAARLASVPASKCAYVGDRIARDIDGARRAGFGLAVQIQHDFEHVRGLQMLVAFFDISNIRRAGADVELDVGPCWDSRRLNRPPECRLRLGSKNAPQLEFPAQNSVTGKLRQAAAKAGKADFIALWAGQAAPLSRALPAAKLIAQLNAEAVETIQQMKGMLHDS